jgi:uncharacterized protein YmfQ (DUF2313 family)
MLDDKQIQVNVCCSCQSLHEQLDDVIARLGLLNNVLTECLLNDLRNSHIAGIFLFGNG